MDLVNIDVRRILTIKLDGFMRILTCIFDQQGSETDFESLIWSKQRDH